MTLFRKSAAFAEVILISLLTASVEPTLLPAQLATGSGYQPAVLPASDEATLAIKKFRVPPGFKVELVAAEPALANPVAFCIDEQGRIYVAETFRHSAVGPAYRYYEGVLDIRSHLDWLDDDLAARTVQDRIDLLQRHLGTNAAKMTGESERVRLLEDTDGDGKADRATVFAEGFNQLPDGVGAGLLARKGDVYFTCIPDLWRLRDTNADGRADVKESLHTGFGVHIAFLGHDLHGLRMGPDGRLYFSIGDRGLHVKTKEGTVLDYPDEGVVLRCNPDGTELEVIARGMRNPQELAFDRFGNLFTGENNSDGGDRARWVQVVEGGDSGWRIGYQHMHDPPRRGPWNGERLWYPHFKGQAAYILPPLANLGYGPSGLTFYPGTGLPDQYADHFFLCDFRGGGSSGIHCFALKPKGASFELTDYSEFVWDTLPTDVDFGVDGGVYFTDWVESWQKTGKGRLYRVHYPALAAHPGVVATRTLLAEGFDQRGADDLSRLLGHPDMRVRQEAQFTLVAKAEAPLLQRLALDRKQDQATRLHAIWGLGQLARRDSKVLNDALGLLQDDDPEVRGQAAKIFGEARWAKATGPLIKLLADSSPRVRLFAALSLGKLKSTKAVPALASLLRANNDSDPYLRHAAVMGLAGTGDIPQLMKRSKDKSPAVRMGVLLALRRLASPELAVFLQDKDPLIVLEAARAIHDVPIPRAVPNLAAMLEQKRTLTLLPRESLATTNTAKGASDLETALSEVRTDTGATPLLEQLLQRVVNAHFRLGRPENAVALSQVAADDTFPDPIRALALGALAQWGKPSGRDSIVGLWRPLAPRDGTPAQAALGRQLELVLRTGSDVVRLAALDATQQLALKPSVPLLARLVADNKTAGDIRARALRTLAMLDSDALKISLPMALEAQDEVLRQEASRIQAGVDPMGAMKQLVQALDHGSRTDKQSALATLATMTAPGVDDILFRWLEQLQRGAVDKELQLDVLNAASQRSDPSILQLLKQLDLEQRKTQLGPFQVAMYGGNSHAGRKIFNERLELSCLRCHKVNGDGGEAGPDLTHVGSRQTREYLVESILFPNNQIAPGYEQVLVTLNNEVGYAGKLVSEAPDHIVVDSPDEGTVQVAKKDIKSRARGLSAMPEEFRQILSKQDLRDLVEYLGGLK